MKVGILFSGGKDSCYSTYLAKKQGYEIACLISIKSRRDDSYMFHIPNIDLVKVQAKALNLPLIFLESSGIKEVELKDLKKALKIAKKEYKIQGIFSGAIASYYQKKRIDRLCVQLKLKSFAPLWQKNPSEYIKELISNKFDVRITGIAADGLNKSWLGRKIDNKCLTDLKKLNKTKGVHIALEGGEAETIVLNCPLFKKKIKIVQAEKVMENTCTGHYSIKKVKLENK